MNKNKTTFLKIILYALLGLFFIFFPGIVSKYVIYIIGSFVIVYGLLNLISVYKTENKVLTNSSLIIIVIGIIIILLSNFILNVIGICIALYCLFSGISNLGFGFKMQENGKPYLLTLIKGSLSLILSVIFFVLPKSAINIQIVILGIYFLFLALNHLFKSTSNEDDFIKFYFKSDYEKNKKDDSVIDVESSVKDENEDNLD